MKYPTANQLYIEVPHFQNALAGFPHNGERFRKQVVERLAVRQALFVLVGFPNELTVGELRERRFQV